MCELMKGGKLTSAHVFPHGLVSAGETVAEFLRDLGAKLTQAADVLVQGSRVVSGFQAYVLSSFVDQSYPLDFSGPYSTTYSLPASPLIFIPRWSLRK